MNENVLAKLKILAESAKYDVSCSSSGTVRRNQAGTLGNTVGGIGICHSFAEDGRCISLLKVMLTNVCIYDCAYCINRRSKTMADADASYGISQRTRLVTTNRPATGTGYIVFGGFGQDFQFGKYVFVHKFCSFVIQTTKGRKNLGSIK